MPADVRGQNERRLARRMVVAIPATIQRSDSKIIDRAAVTIYSLSVSGLGLRHPARMEIGEQFTIAFAGHIQTRHAIRCVVTGCKAAKGSHGFMVGAAFLESAGVGG